MPRQTKPKQSEPDPAVTKGVPLKQRWKDKGLLEHYHQIGPSALCAATMFGKVDKRKSATSKKS